MSWTTKLDDAGNVCVCIDGYLDEVEGQRVIEAIVALLGPCPRDLVLDLAGMSGYRRSVRVAWQTALVAQRGQIRQIVLLGGNPVVRMGFSVMARALGIPATAPSDAAEPDAPVRRARSGSSSLTRPMSRPITRPAPAGQSAGESTHPDKVPPKREASWGGILLQRIRTSGRSQ